MHGSKGQEFDHVWIVGVDDQILPGRKGAHQDAVLESRRLEEERRILYVAVTRAKDQLHISASEKTSYSAYSKDRTECRFLSALPFNLRPRQAYHGPAEPMRLTM
jgi:superfamily I DNA/RNA helicase